MTDLISFVSNSTTAADQQAANDRATLTDNFDTFLTLLTAQIQNQDPLEPLDSAEFTNQLVQYSGVEQQIRTNDQLETLISSNNNSTGAALSGYIGQVAEIESSGAGFHGDQVEWSYRLGGDAASSTFTIADESGTIIWSEEAATTTGAHTFSWDGQTLDGGTADPDNVYYANLIAFDANGETVASSTRVRARVTGIDLSYGDPAITTTAGIYGYADILRIAQN